MTVPEDSSRVRDSFDRAAASYDSTRRLLVPCFDEFYRTVVAMAPFETGEAPRVLDLGTGTGLLASFVLERFPRARMTLVDISPEMLERARARFREAGAAVSVLEMDYSREEIPGRYDLVVSALSIHHLEGSLKRALFRRIHDALEPGGAFINADHVEAPTPGLVRLYRDLWIARARELGVSAEDLSAALERTGLDRLSTLEEQLEWLRGCGFRDVDCHYKWLHFAVFGGRRAES